MPYRPRSTDVWFNLPGVVAAWQPVAAPDPLAARQNVSHDARRAGVYTATGGVDPTWAGHTGWTFNGSSQYLSSGVNSGYNASRSRYDRSICVRWTGATFGGTNHRAIGAHYSAAVGLGLGKYFVEAYMNGANATGGTPAAAGVYAIDYSGDGYKNGVYQATAGTSANSQNVTMPIGASSWGGGVEYFFAGSIPALLIAIRSLSAAEHRMIAHQMAWCHANPDWSAWGRRRRYYYAPGEATVRWRGIGRNDTPVSGRISTGRPI